MSSNLVRRYTTAPPEYDGFGTIDLGITGETSGKQVRLVWIEDKHLYWQEARYGSGMHPSWTPGQWWELVNDKLATSNASSE